MGAIVMGGDLQALMLRSESNWLRQHVESVSSEIRERLWAAANELRDTSGSATPDVNANLVRAARRLERLALPESDGAD